MGSLLSPSSRSTSGSRCPFSDVAGLFCGGAEASKAGMPAFARSHDAHDGDGSIMDGHIWLALEVLRSTQLNQTRHFPSAIGGFAAHQMQAHVTWGLMVKKGFYLNFFTKKRTHFPAVQSETCPGRVLLIECFIELFSFGSPSFYALLAGKAM